MEITPELEKQCSEIIAQYPKKRSAAMIMMHLIQEKFGYFDDSAIKLVCRQNTVNRDFIISYFHAQCKFSLLGKFRTLSKAPRDARKALPRADWGCPYPPRG